MSRGLHEREARTLRPEREARFFAGVARAEEFFMGTADVQRALLRLTETLEQMSIPYAICGAMALNEYGYQRMTANVDVLLTPAGLESFKTAWLGRGYVEKFPGSKGFHDTEHNVMIDVLLTGEYPGDGKPKAVSFPDPEAVAIRGERGALLPAHALIELKLASGMTANHRLKDLADVQELIKHASLPRTLGEELDPSVRERYFELWDAAQITDPE